MGEGDADGINSLWRMRIPNRIGLALKLVEKQVINPLKCCLFVSIYRKRMIMYNIIHTIRIIKYYEIQSI